MEGTKQEVGYKEGEQLKTGREETENRTSQNQGGAESDNPQTVHLISEEKLKTVLDDLKTKPTFCLIHKETEVSLFCKSCDRLVCTSCVIDGNHGNHRFCKIDDVVMTKKQELEERIEEAKEEMTKSLQQNIRILTNWREHVSENCKIVSAEIDDRKNKMLQEVEAWSINLQSMVRENQRKRLQKFDDLLAESDTCLANLELFERNSNYGETIDGKKLIQVLELLQNSTGPESEDEYEGACDESEAESDESEAECDEGESGGSEAECGVYQDESEGEQELIFTTGEENADKMDIWFGQLTGIIPVFTLCKKSLKFKFCDSQIEHISPLDEKRAFVVTEEKLYFVDLTKGKYTQENLVPLMEDVVYVTPVTKRGIYVQQRDSTVVSRVTAAGQVYLFADLEPNSTKESWQTIRISDTGKVISITETKFILSNRYRKASTKMMKYNNSGIKSYQTFCLNYSEDHFLYNKEFPESVQTASDIYVLTTSKDIPDQPGTIMNLKDTSFTYKGCIGSDPEQRFHPRGLCKDQDDHLIVSDYWNHAIHQLTPEGKFRKFLMREENGPTHPTVVGVDSLNWMWVAQEDGNIHVIKYIP